MTLRGLTALILAVCVSTALPGCATSGPGLDAPILKRAGTLREGMGVAVLSVRSAIFLDAPLSVYFLREGGNIANENDVIVFERKQGGFALDNDTVEYKPRAYELPPGTYRLIAHGMACDSIPTVEQRCSVERRIMGRKREFVRPSRGYGPVAPSFEVRAGAITYAGDFALTGRNKIEWSRIPDSELAPLRADLPSSASAPAPIVPDSFALRYPLVPREYASDMGRYY